MNLKTNFEKFKNIFFKRENIIIFLLIVIIFFLDRYSKILIINNFNKNSFYLNDFINYNLTWNTGIGFGLLNFGSYVFYNLITVIIGFVISIILYLTFISKKTDKIIFSIICGGALGNFYDRIIFNAVPDFIDIHYNDFHWFTFNISDIFITLGIISYLIRGFLVKNS
jgi:signal peptidase II